MYSYDDLSPRDGEGPVCSLGHLPADLPHVAGPGAREGCGRGRSPQVVGLARALHGHRANAGVPMIGLHGYTMVTISIGAYNNKRAKMVHVIYDILIFGLTCNLGFL